MAPPPRLTSFASASRFRAWLARNHQRETDLQVRCMKVGTARPGITYREALDEALCFGWIDGVRHAVDEHSFSVRFSPRKPRSIWSNINIRRMAELEAEGRVTAPGRKAFEAREAARSGVYSFESPPAALPPAFERRFRAEASAWRHFQAQPPWYRRTSTFWVVSAKREATRARRLETLIAASARGQPIPGLDRTPRGGAKSRASRPRARAPRPKAR